MMPRLRAIASLLVAAPLLAGCVAMAIPAVAGGALLHKRQSDRPPETADEALPAGRQLIRTDLAALPPPVTAASPNKVSIDALATYVEAAASGAEGAKRESALLADPASLQPDRKDCGALPAAVFVDLDPGKAQFDPHGDAAANNELARVIGALRDEGIAIAWISRAPEAEVGAVGARLKVSGLDPAGNDRIALSSGDTKEDLRQTLSATLCPIALVGDERADFDDVYPYLKDPASAVALESLINHGWFIASPFMATDQTEQTGNH